MNAINIIKESMLTMDETFTGIIREDEKDNLLPFVRMLAWIKNSYLYYDKPAEDANFFDLNEYFLQLIYDLSHTLDLLKTYHLKNCFPNYEMIKILPDLNEKEILLLQKNLLKIAVFHQGIMHCVNSFIYRTFPRGILQDFVKIDEPGYEFVHTIRPCQFKKLRLLLNQGIIHLVAHRVYPIPLVTPLARDTFIKFVKTFLSLCEEMHGVKADQTKAILEVITQEKKEEDKMDIDTNEEES